MSMQATLNELIRLYLYVCVTTVVEEEEAVTLGESWGGADAEGAQGRRGKEKTK